MGTRGPLGRVTSPHPGALVRVKDDLRMRRDLSARLRRASSPLYIPLIGPPRVRIYPPEVVRIIDGLSDEGRDLVLRAYEYADRAFRGRIRKSGKAYITHLVNTTLILREICEIKDPALLAAGLLHDIIEDTKVTGADLRREFGNEVADLVLAETKLSEALEHEKRDLVNFTGLFRSMSYDPRVVILKCADCLDNMEDQEVFTEEEYPGKQREHAEEAMMYASIADRIGLWEMRTLLEDRAYRYLEAERFGTVEKFALKRVKSVEKVLKQFASDLAAVLAAKKIPFSRVEVRQRAISELFRKMERQDLTFEEVFARNPLYMNFILVEVKEEDADLCFKILSILRDSRYEQALDGFSGLDERVKDFINHPRDNGYRALQTSMYKPGEPGVLLVTITTREMNDFNRLGLASVGKKAEFRRDWQHTVPMKWLNVLGEEMRSVESTDEVRLHVLGGADAIRVFTPAGDEKKLRPGSSVLDFAYMIHGSLIFEAVGATINGRRVENSLFYELKGGEIVEIIKGDARPSVIWLDHIQSPSARGKIKRYLEGRETASIYKDALQALNEAGRKYSITAQQLIDTLLFSRYLARTWDIKTKDVSTDVDEKMKFIHAIGTGKINATEVTEGLNQLYLEALSGLEGKRDRLETRKIRLKVVDRKNIIAALSSAISDQGFNISSLDMKTRGAEVEIEIGVDVFQGKGIENGEIIGQIQRIQVLNIAQQFDPNARFLIPKKV